MGVLLIALGNLAQWSWLPVAFAALLFFGFMGLWSRRETASTTQEIARASAGQVPLEAALKNVAQWRALDGRKMLATLAQRLAAAGKRGLTVRYSRTPPGRVRRMEQPFEPEPLGDVRSVAAWLTGQDPGAEHQLQRQILRHVRLRGGWIIVNIFAVSFAFAAWEAWRLGQLTLRLLAWTVALCGVFLVPLWNSAGGEWLVAPSALILRPRIGLRTTRAHLFSRPDSVLLTGPVNAEVWAFAVSDGRKTESGSGTREDMDALLCAWLSPLPPPDPARISDLE
jgi:hypothetical protein